MNPVVAILCGGFGTLLGTLTRDVPKPMIEIGGRTYIEHVGRILRRAQSARFVLLMDIVRGYRRGTRRRHEFRRAYRL